jgi:Spx/MgsR family transcriptional regulator
MMAGMKPSTLTLYGIPNCNTVKNARAWLTEQGVAFVFHDFKKQGVPADQLPGWIAAVGWELLLNRKGTTWRKLDEATRADILDEASAAALMLAQPSVIKRPVVVWPTGQVSVGFDATRGDACPCRVHAAGAHLNLVTHTPP